MDIGKILFALIITSLLAGCVCAASVNDFKIDSSYNSTFSSDYYSVYLNDRGNSGVAIYKNVDDDRYDDLNDEIVDDIVHEDGRDYLGDEDIQILKNDDHTANFTDYDHLQHGVVEVIESDNNQYIVVFFTKYPSNIKDADLILKLNDFNKDNNVTAVAF